MNRSEQRARADQFRALHHADRMLVLPNIWDPLGARMLEALGYPAVATASAAVAYARGHDDGEQLPFERLLEIIAEIAGAVQIPLTADIEGGYADSPEPLAANIRQVITAGAVGINLEDSRGEGKQVRPVAEQCERIRAVRDIADREGMPLVINARVDVFLDPSDQPREARIHDAIQRGRAYLKAGADCIYPIGPGDAATAATLKKGLDAPINLYLSAEAAPLSTLQEIGIARVSLGPGLLRASLSAMRDVARDLLEGRSYERFTTASMQSDELRGYAVGRPKPVVPPTAD